MSDEPDLQQAEALLRAHYARIDPGALRSEAVKRIRADLEAAGGGHGATVTSRLRLDPVHANAPTARVGLGWSLAAAAVVALLVVSWITIGRLSGPPVAGSPSAMLSPGVSAPSVASSSPAASAGSAGPSLSAVASAPAPSGSASDQRAIAFTDSNHGIVVGGYQGQGAVWTTADGGQTWASQLVSTPPLDSLAVVGTQAWASASCVGVDGACTPAVVASDDSGATWQIVGATPVQSLTFVDAQHGFGVAPGSIGVSHLLETTDGSRTWEPMRGAAPCEAGFGPAGVSFTDAKHGWVACLSGESAVGLSSKEVVVTDDGGATWSVRSRVRLDGTLTLGQLPTEGIFRGINMLASGTGIAWLWNEGLIRTADGGVTWTRLPLGDVAGDLQWPGAAIAPDGSLFALTVDVVSGDGPATFNLGFTDGRDWKPYVEFGGLSAPGTTPTPEPTSPPQPAIADSGVAFFDASNGIAIGNGASHAYLWRTGDGGKTWTTSALRAASARLMAIDGRVWISTSSCTTNPPDPNACTSALERSDDRGATWRVVGHQTLTSMSFGDATHGYAVGAAVHPSNGDTVGGLGTGVFETLDGGATWTALPKARPCGNLDPTSVSFVSATHGWLGCEGAGGAGEASKGVMETTDGGRTWSWRLRIFEPSGSPTTIGSISIVDYLDTLSMQPDGSGFMTSLRGSTFRTSDGGRTWTSCPPGEFDAFNTSQAAIVPGGPWFVVQSGWITQDTKVMQARLMRSDDLGKTWKQVGGLPSP